VGILELSECERYGQLIAIENTRRKEIANPYVGMDLLREHHFRWGQKIRAIIQRCPNFQIHRVISVNKRNDMIAVEGRLSVRIIDMFCPIGK
jgi:transcription termination factor Rho